MIGVIAQGRLGNQMFQFAFAYTTSKKLNTSFFIHKHNSLHYFNLYEGFEKKNKRNALHFAFLNVLKKSSIPFSIKSARRPLTYLFNWAISKNVCIWNNTIDDKNYLLSKIKNNVLYDGFFQSEEYFIQFQEDIKNLFEINKYYQKLFLEKKQQLLKKKYIAIHLRRNDYLNYGGEELGGTDMTLPISFYKNCISKIKDIGQYNVIFVSDDIEFAKKEFGNCQNYFYENNDEITDFQLLLNANILIIANSTFSWWAAWLNKKEDKLVFAPKYFIGFKVNKFYPAGIKVDAWNWIDVN